METEDSEEQVCPFCGFRLKNFAELKDHIVTYHKTELKEGGTSDNVLTEATLEKLQRQAEIEKAQEIREKYPLAPVWRGVIELKERKLLYGKMLFVKKWGEKII